MRTLHAIASPPSYEDVLVRGMPPIAPEPRDLDRARALIPSLKPDTDWNCGYVDQDGILYFAVLLEVVRLRPTIGNPGPLVTTYWQRYNYKTCGGYTEPEDAYEYKMDESNVGFPSLSDAAEATRHDLLQRELDAVDNTCYECYESGKDDFHGKGPCTQCGGIGYHRLTE